MMQVLCFPFIVPSKYVILPLCGLKFVTDLSTPAIYSFLFNAQTFRTRCFECSAKEKLNLFHEKKANMPQNHNVQSSYAPSLQITTLWPLARTDVFLIRCIIHVCWVEEEISSTLNQGFLAGINESGSSATHTHDQMHMTAYVGKQLFTVLTLSHSLPGQVTTQLHISQTLPQFDSESPFCKSRGVSHPSVGPREEVGPGFGGL